MFLSMPKDFAKEFQEDVHEGDLLEIKEGMMLIEPRGPVMVLKADNDAGLYEIMYLSNNYTVGCGRMEIRRKLCEVE